MIDGIGEMMKKIDTITTYSGNEPPDAWLIDMHRAVNHLIDLVNSQQEAIEKLERVFGEQTIPSIVLPTDDKPKAETNDTHRIVILRIPRGMTIGRTILEAMGSSQSSVLSKSDTALQKALDRLKGEKK